MTAPLPIADAAWWGPAPIRALSLHQPWASLMSLGLKVVESRHWSTTYRGPLAIHAAQKLEVIDRETWHAWMTAAVDRDPAAAEQLARLRQMGRLPRGAFVCVIDLAACIPSEEFNPGPAEALFGRYAAGRYAWATDPRRLRRLDPPVAAKGLQGFWTPDPAAQAALRAAAVTP